MKITFPAFIIPLLTLFLLAGCAAEDELKVAHGVFEAQEIMVSAQASGQILNFALQEGDVIKADQPLGLIDTTFLAFQKDLISEQSNTAQTAGLTDVTAQTQAIKDQIDALKKERDRVKRLVEAEVLSAQKLDEVEAKLSVAESQLTAATKQIGQQNASSRGTVSTLNVQKGQVQELINRSVISSPIDGTVLAIYLHSGELAGQGRPIFKVADLSRLTLRAYVTAEQLSSIRLGDQVLVYSDLKEEKSKPYPGKVTWISSQAEFTPKNIQTADDRASLIYAVKVQVINDGTLRIGQYGKVELNR